MSKTYSPLANSLPRVSAPNRQSARPGLAALVAAVLAACTGGPEEGDLGYVSGFFGGVVADEPRAALVGRDVLSAGGSAADAAVAIYFTMAVTYPGAASLGGGGVCLVHDPVAKRTEALEFFASRPARVTPGAERPTAVPGNVRGMFALHARYGLRDWGALLRPAERLARQGNAVSRAFATELRPAARGLFTDAAARDLFAQADGSPVVEGQLVRQVELAAVLTVLRSQGPGAFYGGSLGRGLVEAVAAAGGTLSLEDLRAYKPRYVAPIRVGFGSQALVFTPAAGGGVAAQLWAILNQDGRYDRAPAEEAPHLFAEAAHRVFADRGRWMDEAGASLIGGEALVAEERLAGLMRGYDPRRHVAASDPAPRASQGGAAGLVVADRFGQVVACNVTLNYPFGTGRIAPGAGILLAAAPGIGGRGATDLGAMLMINENNYLVYYGAVASGGSAAPTAQVRVALETLGAGAGLSAALASPRLHHGGEPDILWHETTLEEAQRVALVARGHVLQPADRLGRVVAFHCPGGLPRDRLCEFAADPRGFGLAISAED